MTETQEDKEMKMVFGEWQHQTAKEILEDERICSYCKGKFKPFKAGGFIVNRYKENLIMNYFFCSLNHIFSFFMDTGGEYEFPDRPEEGKKK